MNTKNYFHPSKKGFVFDMRNTPGLCHVAGGEFFMFHHGCNNERKNMDISEKYIGAMHTMRGAKKELSRIIEGKKELKYISYPTMW